MNGELRSLVLASASPRRLELLASLGLHVTVIVSGYDEPSDPSVTPADLATSHAHAKALAVRERVPHACIVAADTVVDINGVALGKPADAAEAVAMLRRLSGREHLVHTAFTLVLPGSPALTHERVTTRVRFHDLTDDEIAAYVATGEPMDKAGAYGIQGRAASLVASIDGDFYTVMGFPLGCFVRTLRRLGFSLPNANDAART